MGKALFIAEKPSVARQFAQALSINGKNNNGYVEGNNTIITWCVGHLITMSYPDVYDEKYKKWSMQTIPFLPDEYKYEVIEAAKKQFEIVKGLLNRPDVDTIYVCTDSGREGEYIYRLVESSAMTDEVRAQKNRRRVWIDSQTDDEIKRGVKEAKDLSEYDNLSAAAYLRAKEDYLMGINFTRALTLKYGNGIAGFLGQRYAVVTVGRVMTCVLGMIVDREREIRNFVKTPFYRLTGSTHLCSADEYSANQTEGDKLTFEAEWKAVPESKYFNSPILYKENGFKKKEDAESLKEQIETSSKAASLMSGLVNAELTKLEKKNEKKNAPLLYNLAELQNDASKLFKISPDATLDIIQELYEKKLVTYPRTDARVLSSAIAKEIDKNLRGLLGYEIAQPFADEILKNGMYKGIDKTKYTNDKQITDHYAIIPTGQGLRAISSLSDTAKKMYEIIVHRFLAIFYGPAVYQKLSLALKTDNGESFFASFKVLADEGYMKATKYSFIKAKDKDSKEKKDGGNNEEDTAQDQASTPELLEALKNLKKGSSICLNNLTIKEGETSPPKRYNSGSLILAMENAGNLIEDEELREQIKGSGIGTSATRAEILKKLVNNKYLSLNNKTQIITPAQLGEMIYEVVKSSIPQLLDPKLTASWEKGLTMVAMGEVSEKEYMEKLNGYVGRRTEHVKLLTNSNALMNLYREISGFYKH